MGMTGHAMMRKEESISKSVHHKVRQIERKRGLIERQNYVSVCSVGRL